jgi:hypothetical protein
MIKKRTVFILGAGANVPYGFSTGGGLVDKVRGKDPRVLMGNVGQQITQRQSEVFRQAVDDNLLPSIDAMLEHRPDLAQVGKRVMATLLYTEEAAAAPRKFDEDWMSLIFSNMARDAPTVDHFGENPTSFVTFNYDRYLEHRFIRGLVARYRADGREAWQKIKHMFMHVYGTLGILPEQGGYGAANTQPINLGARDEPGVYTLGLALPVIERTILTVHDVADSRATFGEAVQRVQSAEQVFFLGFGFGEENVQRLQTHRIPNSAAIYCTTYDMTHAEINALVVPAFPGRPPPVMRVNGLTGSESIKRFLREFVQTIR